MMRIAHVVGARPQFVKLGPVARAIAAAGVPGARWQQDVVHTGQHYDPQLSERFFDELGLPAPRINLGVGSDTHGAQTGRMLAGLEQAFVELSPSLVLVYGDTNSTLAGALAAAKMHIPVAHIEAGLRSLNRAMPEEINRVATDHVSDLLLAPTPAAMAHLAREGLAARSRLVGDVMADAVGHSLSLSSPDDARLAGLGLAGRRYALATVHRAESTTAAVLPDLVGTLERCAAEFETLLWPLHPRTREALRASLPGWRAPDNLIVCEPLGHSAMLRLIRDAAVVLTDSGGLQKEAFLLGTPCVTLRSETEWVESVQAGANVIAGSRPQAVLEALRALLHRAPPRAALVALAARAYGHGDAAMHIVAALDEFSRGTSDER
ncbi:MAG: UDP-N-acetylglucosamine 2-epimerase (non-hydrolyzing) [Burkholderiaceae bacterium]|nr:UDP-N-acetylglucosamine 2-epimerase (non-hydrolyzing) [Burkholderiaceae bacterium]